MGVNTFAVRKALNRDVGLSRARMHYTRRDGSKRYDIVEISHERRQVLACVLGHDEASDHIYLDFDLRQALGVEAGQSCQLSVKRAGWSGSLRWYLCQADPVVKVPAWLAVWSVLLGLMGIALAFLPLLG